MRFFFPTSSSSEYLPLTCVGILQDGSKGRRVDLRDKTAFTHRDVNKQTNNVRPPLYQATKPPDTRVGISLYQRVFEGDRALPFPLGLEHVGEVLGARAEHAAVGREHAPVNQELDVAVRALLQQPAGQKNSEGSLLHPHRRPRLPIPASHSRVQEVAEVVPLHGAHADALVVLEQAADGLVQGAVHAALAVERVGLALGAWKGGGGTTNESE